MQPVHWNVVSLGLATLLVLAVVWFFSRTVPRGKNGEVIPQDKVLKVTLYYSKKCSHCVRFKPTWDALGAHMCNLVSKGLVELTEVDCENDSRCSRIKSIPTTVLKYGDHEEVVKGVVSLEELVQTIEGVVS